MLTDLLEKNQAWAEKVSSEDPEFFSELCKGQSPEYLWIGCSDSRVPEARILDSIPGEVFVHRNIANQVIHTDLNCQSVVQYAVEVLKVKHIIICGHHCCGGVEAALEDHNLGLMDSWLNSIKATLSLVGDSLTSIEDDQLRKNLACELNAIAQVQNMATTPFVEKAWKNHQELSIHGWIFIPNKGLIQDLGVSVSSSAEAENLFLTHSKRLINAI